MTGLSVAGPAFPLLSMHSRGVVGAFFSLVVLGYLH